jgi:hypothetical protein
MATLLRSHGDQQLEAQRENAQQASREVAQLDPHSVLATLRQWVANGEVERARAFMAEWKAGQR